MRSTKHRLSDGREIIYYQRDDGQPAPAATDLRRLVPGGGASQVRRDPTTGDWIIVAGHRQARSYQPTVAECPLCPSRDGHATEIPAADYEVVVFENRFPALAATTNPTNASTTTKGIADSAPGHGRCEVVCFTSDHDASFGQLTAGRAGLVLDVWIDRSRELSQISGVAQVFCFENRGAELGTTQPHPHGQIYAFPFVTPRTAQMLDRARAYRQSTGGNLAEDLLASELAIEERIVVATGEWVAFVPAAARWPYEVHLYPRRRRASLMELDDAQRDGFPAVYLDLLQRFDRLFDVPTPYVSGWHQAPVVANFNEVAEFAVHIELFTNQRAADKLKVLGGTELAMGVFSNDVGPENAARRLRELG
jgi:UDPglucose--hexose-1-phosphate uridylyltransferase